jgi:hypothetical protein
MQLPFAARSRFTAPMVQTLLMQRAAFEAGEVITIMLTEIRDGYPGQAIVDLTLQHPSGFLADWTGQDATRFPARLRAAATALNEIGARGRFVLIHRAGELTIQRAPLR